MVSVKTTIKNIVKQIQWCRNIVVGKSFSSFEVVVIIQNIKVGYNILVGQIITTKANDLVEDRKGIPQGTVSFLGDGVQGFLFSSYSFVFSHISQVIGNIFNLNSFEIKYLTTG